MGNLYSALNLSAEEYDYAGAEHPKPSPDPHNSVLSWRHLACPPKTGPVVTLGRGQEMGFSRGLPG